MFAIMRISFINHEVNVLTFYLVSDMLSLDYFNKPLFYKGRTVPSQLLSSSSNNMKDKAAGWPSGGGGSAPVVYYFVVLALSQNFCLVACTKMCRS